MIVKTEYKYRYDPAITFKQHNPSMCDTHGKNERPYQAEQNLLWIRFHKDIRWKTVYGKANLIVNTLMMGGIIYGCAINTAKEQ